MRRRPKRGLRWGGRRAERSEAGGSGHRGRRPRRARRGEDCSHEDGSREDGSREDGRREDGPEGASRGATRSPGDDALLDLIERRPGITSRQLEERLEAEGPSEGPVADRLREGMLRGDIVPRVEGGWESADGSALRVATLGRVGRGGARARPVRKEEAELFVRGADVGAAWAGDVVLVRVLSRPRGRRLAEATVLNVVERTRRPIRGRYHATKRGGVVVAGDDGKEREIRIPADRLGGAEHGDRVLVRLGPPGRGGSLRGEVLARLAEDGSLDADLEQVRAEFELPGDHSPEAVAAAEALEPAGSDQRWPDRLDLRTLATFTIDPADAKDFDDALSLEPVRGGGWRLGVHIADVAHYVPSGSLLDRVAAERGTSIYFPGQVLPMLPERLADDLCSLRPGEDRLTRSVLLTYDAGWQHVGCEVRASVIRSRRRFTYEEVQAVFDRLDGRPSDTAPEDADEWLPTLDTMRQLRARLLESRRRRGALSFEIPKLALVLDDAGETSGVREELLDEAHSLVEECMLAANEAVARRLGDKRMPMVSRVHSPPDEERLAELWELLRAAGIRPGPTPDARALQSIVDDVTGTPLASVVQVAVLRTMGHAEYVAGPGSHFALASDAYCHFTSPIRRYPDLLIHQVLTEEDRGRLESAARRQEWWDRLPALAESSSGLERRAESAERAMLSTRLLRYLEPRLGEEFEATIISMFPFGFFARVESLLLEGLVPVATLGSEFFEYDTRRVRLVGRDTGATFRLGDVVRVVLSDMDPATREVGLRYAGKPG